MDMFDKAKDLAKDHGDEAVQAVDKATDAIDEKTGGKATGALDAVDAAAEKAKDALQ